MNGESARTVRARRIGNIMEPLGAQVHCNKLRWNRTTQLED